MMTDSRQEKEFLEMLSQCEDILVRVCVCFTHRGRGDYRDLYQEIACTLWYAWPTFRGKSNVRTWVIRIALNVASDEIKELRRKPQFVELDESFYEMIDEESSDACIRRLYDLIDGIKNSVDKKVLYLYLEHKQIKEVAKITGLSIVATRQRIHRIIKKLNIQKSIEDESKQS